MWININYLSNLKCHKNDYKKYDIYKFILKKNNIYYISLILKNKIFIILLTNYIEIINVFDSIKLYIGMLKNLNYLNKFFFSWNNFFIKKLKVRHKISWLKLFRKKYFLMRINFGFSYNIFFFLNNFFFRKKKKIITYSNIIFWNLNKLNLFKITKFIINIQPLNSYTLRGFKFSKQKFKKRVGKISKYTEFKSKLL